MSRAVGRRIGAQGGPGPRARVAARLLGRGAASLPGRKGREVAGVIFLVAALLIAAALLSYSPTDSSLFHRASQGGRVGNWVGPIGANISAAALGLVGLTSFVVPVLLIVATWRRLGVAAQEAVVGRGLGTGLVLLSLPCLLHLTVGEIAWQGVGLRSGGVLGLFVGDFLTGRLGALGAVTLVVGAVTVGLILLVQSSLGELLGTWGRRWRSVNDVMSLRRTRLREQRDKGKTRRRLIEKHMQAKVEPARVEEREGQGRFSIRRVASSIPTVGKKTVKKNPSTRRLSKKAAQKRMAFVEEPDPTTSALPPVNLLNLQAASESRDEKELIQLGELITQRCHEFGVEGTIEGISPGPLITVFELQPAPGVKVSQIVNLQNDLALALRAESVRIDRVAGRSVLGIEVPNVDRETIALGPLLGSERFRSSPSPLTLAIGRDLHGEPYYADLATMPHLLVAGATGSGKSVGLQSMITSILYKARREEVQFIFIDPKRIELGVYSDIPHLKAEVVVEPKKAANALRWAVAEMERRYRLLAELHVRSISYYNHAISDPQIQRRLSLQEEDSELLEQDLAPLPYYVVIIDELADLMMVSSSDVETAIARLAQMARAVGIHLIVATQRPSVDILTGTIKANFPCRISYATASRHDSRTILDQVGSEQLLGDGDMLFMPPGTARLQRLHGAYISEQETAALVRWLKKQGKPLLDPKVLEGPPEDRTRAQGSEGEDELFDEAARMVVAEGQASASFLQRRMRIGFSRAARLIDLMERDGLLGPPQGSKPREVLVRSDYFSEIGERGPR
ncbi:MAG: DNA translocase FtsK 4TM domain-containing protein [Acidobacteriota bacterium]|nr:DNA translocase FtsK 4TM domain-containing protein [Acidobacteriota bacterium]